MQGIDPNVVVTVLWGLAIIGLAWTWIPALISAFGGTRYLNGWVEDPAGAESNGREPDYHFWSMQLQQLGYEPLGKGWVRINFAAHEWSLFSEVRIWYHAERLTFAVLQKAPAPFRFWPGVAFVTLWSDGRMLVTDNNDAREPDPEDALIRQGVVTLALAETDNLHEATCEALKRRGGRPDAHATIETLFQAMQIHLGPLIGRSQQHQGKQYMFAHLLIHLCVSLPAASVWGLMHWSLPLTNAVLAFILLFGESSQKRQYARAVANAMREKVNERTNSSAPPATSMGNP